MSNTVAIYKDNKWERVISGFSPIECHVVIPSRVITAPVQSGVKIGDVQVLDPVNVVIVGKINASAEYNPYYGSSIVDDDRRTQKDIDRIQQDVGKSLVSVSTKDGFYNNLALETIESTNTTKEYDLAEYKLKFVQVIIKQAMSRSCADRGNDAVRRTGYTATMYM